MMNRFPSSLLFLFSSSSFYFALFFFQDRMMKVSIISFYFHLLLPLYSKLFSFSSSSAFFVSVESLNYETIEELFFFNFPALTFLLFLKISNFLLFLYLFLLLYQTYTAINKTNQKVICKLNSEPNSSNFIQKNFFVCNAFFTPSFDRSNMKLILSIKNILL